MRSSTNRFDSILGVVTPLPLYAVMMYTFWLPGYEKLFDRERTVPYYGKIFEESILGRLGLTNLLITSMGIVELSIVAIFALSLLRREFLPGSRAQLLKLALLLSATMFALLGFGLRLVQNHAGTANQFYYFGFTVIFLALTQLREQTGSKSSA